MAGNKSVELINRFHYLYVDCTVCSQQVAQSRNKARPDSAVTELCFSLGNPWCLRNNKTQVFLEVVVIIKQRGRALGYEINRISLGYEIIVIFLLLTVCEIRYKQK